MLNRRKQPRGFDDQAGEERQSLLGVSSQEFIRPSTSVVNNQHRVVTFSQYDPSNGDFSTTGWPTDKPIPTLRKAFVKSPGPDNSTIRYSSLDVPKPTPSSSVPTHHDFGDYYELDPVSATSRAIIDISGSRDYINSRQQQTNYIIYTIQPGDTLHNLSVKYSCPVASIKRINNLWSDQEFYGLSRIKLPAGKLRLIEDVIDEENTSSISTFKDPVSPHLTRATTFSPNNNNTLGYSTETIKTTYPEDIPRECFLSEELKQHDAQKDSTDDTITSYSIFKDLDFNIEKARSAAKSYNDNASAIMKTLAQNGDVIDGDCEELSEANKVARKEAETLLNDLSDYGLSYNFLILFIFIVCLVCPLAYVIYIEETHHDTNKTL